MANIIRELSKRSVTITIADVAKRAGVSTATVSRVMNKTENVINVSEATRQKIERAMKELDYNPSYLARGFQSQKSCTIGVIVGDLHDIYYTELIAGAEQACYEENYLHILFGLEPNFLPMDHYVGLFKQRRLDGIAVVGESSNVFENEISYLVGKGLPVVQIARKIFDENVPAVTFDQVKAANLAVKLLVDLGHRRIAYMGGCVRPRVNTMRLQGYKDILQKSALQYDEGLVCGLDNLRAQNQTGSYSESLVRPQLKNCRREIEYLMLLADPPTAIFCFNDTIAMACLSALRELGLSVPQQISVVGYDDISFSEWLSPALTTIHQPRYEMGYKGVKKLISILNGIEPEQKHELLDCELIIRKSTAPCNKYSTEYAIKNGSEKTL